MPTCFRSLAVSRRQTMADCSIHFDPEFDTYTYGDPTPPKAGLRHLEAGDLLVFYCGLQGWDFCSPAGLFIVGYFAVEAAGRSAEFTDAERKELFAANFHVKHSGIFETQKEALVLVKGGVKSRLLDVAVPMSTVGRDSRGRAIKILSSSMRTIFNFSHSLPGCGDPKLGS